jgi:hypothetical protein
MVSLGSLWLPILLSAVAVFIASSVIHMLLTYHKKDIAPVPNEDRVMDAVRGTPRGVYVFPYAAGMKEMNDPAIQEKYKRGPVAVLTVLPTGPVNMGKILPQWFVLTLVVSLFVAYILSRTVASGAEYLGVFRIAATITFLAYAGAEASHSIWAGQPWSNTLRHFVDALVYGLVSAGVFGALWPR